MKEEEEKKNLVIKNTEARLVVLPALASTDPKVARGMRLLPGENDVPEWYWRKCLNTRAVAMWAASGVLVNQGVGTAKSLDQGLDALHKQDAFIRIQKCKEVKIIKDWKEKTASADLKKQCDDRINELVAAEGKE